MYIYIYICIYICIYIYMYICCQSVRHLQDQIGSNTVYPNQKLTTRKIHPVVTPWSTFECQPQKKLPPDWLRMTLIRLVHATSDMQHAPKFMLTGLAVCRKTTAPRGRWNDVASHSMITHLGLNKNCCGQGILERKANSRFWSGPYVPHIFGCSNDHLADPIPPYFHVFSPGGFHKWGEPPVIIQFRLGFSRTKTIHFWVAPWRAGNPHIFPLLTMALTIVNHH